MRRRAIAGTRTLVALIAVATDSSALVMGARPWSVDSLADSIRIQDLVGMADGGLRYVLGFRSGSDTLRGRLVLHTDAGPPFTYSGGMVRAIRIQCRGGSGA